jgi:hypothetical protein
MLNIPGPSKCTGCLRLPENKVREKQDKSRRFLNVKTAPSRDALGATCPRGVDRFLISVCDRRAIRGVSADDFSGMGGECTEKTGRCKAGKDRRRETALVYECLLNVGMTKTLYFEVLASNQARFGELGETW